MALATGRNAVALRMLIKLGLGLCLVVGSAVFFSSNGTFTGSAHLRETDLDSLHRNLQSMNEVAAQELASVAELEIREAELVQSITELGRQRTERSISSPNETTSTWVQTGKGKRIAFVSAYQGAKYNIMGTLASDTKAKYAAYHGYAYFLDNDLLRPRMSFNEISAIRIEALQRHWSDYDWLVWTDSDVLITNPELKLEDFIEAHAPEGSGIHVLMSKDWGGRQVNPGVSLIRTSAEGRQFLTRWKEEIELLTDDLLAIRDGIEKKKGPELKYLKFVAQQELNSYPADELRFEPYNRKTVEHDKSHQLWKAGDRFVHVVNCLRQGGYDLDVPCCNGIAARYWYEFQLRMDRLRETEIKHNEENGSRLGWMRDFPASLCL